MTSTASPVTTIRPTHAARRRTLLWGLLPIVPVSIFTLVNPALGWSRFVILLVMFALIGIYLVLYVTQTRLEYGDGTYSYSTAFFRRRFTAGDVERVVAVDELFYGLNGARMLFVVGRTRRRLFRMNSIAWDTAQLEGVVNDLIGRGAALTHYAERLTPGEFERREPGVLYWFEAHRVAFLLIVLAATLLIVVAVVVVLILVLTAAVASR